MTHEFDVLLDTALQRLEQESTSDILADYPAQAEQLAPLLDTAALLKSYDPVPLPTAEQLAADRQQYIERLVDLPSPGIVQQLSAWVAGLFSLPYLKPHPQRQEKRGMTTFVKAMVTMLLAFGITGGTVATSATNSLPDSTLYPVKLALEEAQLALNRDAAGQVETHLILAQHRVEEMERMMAKGEVPDEAVRNRLEAHLREAVNAAAGAPEEEMTGLLLRIRERVQEQTETMTRLQNKAGEQGKAELGNTLRYMHRVRQECEFGMNEPQQFRWEYKHGQVPEDRPCASADCEPAGEQHQYGPAPEEGFGPGQKGGSSECPDGECEPAGEQHQYGPAPKEGFGPGQSENSQECETTDCEPVGEENKYGPQPEEGPGPGQPGGNPDCPNGDCEPAGEEHKHRNGASAESPEIALVIDEIEPVGEEYKYGPTPEEGFGPGEPGDQECEPAAEQYGPTPEEGFGPGEPGDHECEPAAEQYGPTPEEGFGPGEPEGNPDCPTGDCEPVSSQYQKGP